MANWNEIYKSRGVIQSEILPAVKEFVKILKKSKHKQLNILDSGCGTGRNTLYLINSLNKNKVLQLNSLDSSTAAIKILKGKLKENRLNNCAKVSIHNLNKGLPFNKNYFDGIVSILVIEHGVIKQIRKWCDDMKRVLKSKGVLVIIVPSIADPRFLTGEEIEKNTKINLKQIDGDIPHHFFTDNEIEGLFKGYKVLHKRLQSRPGVTTNVLAQQLEYILQKP